MGILEISMPRATLKDLQERAAAHDPDAHYQLGKLYMDGSQHLHIEKNPVKAVEHYKLAANSGYSVAEYALAKAYASGRGLTKDVNLAMYYYELAARKGMPGALKGFEDLCLKEERFLDAAEFFHDFAIKENDKGLMATAVTFYTKAVDNDPKAAYILGQIYEKGDLVEQDPHIAVAWYSKAADKNVQEAQEAVNRLRGPRLERPARQASPNPPPMEVPTSPPPEVTMQHLKSSLTQIKTPSMVSITSQLITNIKQRSPDSSAKKLRLLTELNTLLKDNKLNMEDDNTQAVVIALCQQFCNMKRNPLDLTTAKSAKEFQEMLNNHKLKADSNIQFNNKEIKGLLDGSGRVLDLIQKKAEALSADTNQAPSSRPS